MGSIHGPQWCAATVFVAAVFVVNSRIFRQRLRDYQPQPVAGGSRSMSPQATGHNDDRNLRHQWGEMHPLSRARRRQPPGT